MNKLLKLSRVNLSYNTDNNLIKVLQDISLEVDHKDTVSIVGESGSGKTSLIMLIGGLEKATSGKIIMMTTAKIINKKSGKALLAIKPISLLAIP